MGTERLGGKLPHGGPPSARRVLIAAVLAPLIGFLISMTYVFSILWRENVLGGHGIGEALLGGAAITLPWAYAGTALCVPICLLLARFGVAGFLPTLSVGLGVGSLSLCYFGPKLWPLVFSYAIPVPIAAWLIISYPKRGSFSGPA